MANDVISLSRSLSFQWGRHTLFLASIFVLTHDFLKIDRDVAHLEGADSLVGDERHGLFLHLQSTAQHVQVLCFGSCCIMCVTSS